MRMNGDQEGRARKMVAETQGLVAPAHLGALYAGVILFNNEGEILER